MALSEELGALSSGIYDFARNQLLVANLNWLITPLVVSAWSGTKVFIPTDSTIANMKAHGAVERGFSLPIDVDHNFVTPDGTAQTDPVVLPAVPIGEPILWFTMSALVTPHDSSKLILFIDETNPALPYMANGLDILLQPDWTLQRGWFRP